MMRELAGNYRYEVRRGDVTLAIETARIGAQSISAHRRDSHQMTSCEVDAVLDEAAKITEISLRYSSTLFKRDARYRADGDSFRGSVSALAGRNEIVIKLGRFGEVEVTGMTAFRNLLLAHVRQRGQPRWTGRVASIDPGTLAASSIKHTCRADPTGKTWTYEARMGDTEIIELDDGGRIVRRLASDGTETRLIRFEAGRV